MRAYVDAYVRTYMRAYVRAYVRTYVRLYVRSYVRSLRSDHSRGDFVQLLLRETIRPKKIKRKRAYATYVIQRSKYITLPSQTDVRQTSNQRLHLKNSIPAPQNFVKIHFRRFPTLYFLAFVWGGSAIFSIFLGLQLQFYLGFEEQR